MNCYLEEAWKNDWLANRQILEVSSNDSLTNRSSLEVYWNGRVRSLNNLKYPKRYLNPKCHLRSHSAWLGQRFPHSFLNWRSARKNLLIVQKKWQVLTGPKVFDRNFSCRLQVERLSPSTTWWQSTQAEQHRITLYQMAFWSLSALDTKSVGVLKHVDSVSRERGSVLLP